MMKVLEVFGEPISNGGQESFVVNVILHMNRSGMQIDLLTPYYCDNTRYQSIVQGWDGCIFELGLKFEPGKSRKKLLPNLYRFLKVHPYDVVHIHSGSISVLTYASLAAKFAGVRRIIVHSHSAGEKKTLKWRVLKLLSAPALRWCPSIHCACSTLAGEFKYDSGIVRKRMRLISNGVDLNIFKYDSAKAQEMRKKLGIAEKTWVIGHVGRFSSEKNHSFLIRLFESLHQRESDSRLLLIGDGELRAEMEQQVKQAGIEDAVMFMGNVSNVPDYLQVMDAFVLPSKFEGLPIVMVEAQAAGVAVVASDAITKETALVRQLQYMSLEAPLEDWVDAVVNAVKTPRFNEADQIIRKGFDIDSTAAEVRALYEM